MCSNILLDALIAVLDSIMTCSLWMPRTGFTQYKSSLYCLKNINMSVLRFQRYVNQLDPNIRRDQWTDEEDTKLIEVYTRIGPKWAEIAKEFPGR